VCIGIVTIFAVFAILYPIKTPPLFKGLSNNIFVEGFVISSIITYILSLILRKNTAALSKCDKEEKYEAEKKMVKSLLVLLQKRNYPDAIAIYNEKITLSPLKKFLTPFILSELLHSRSTPYIVFAKEIISQYLNKNEDFFLPKIDL
jgi:hypothetical protein